MCFEGAVYDFDTQFCDPVLQLFTPEAARDGEGEERTTEAAAAAAPAFDRKARREGTTL